MSVNPVSTTTPTPSLFILLQYKSHPKSAALSVPVPASKSKSKSTPSSLLQPEPNTVPNAAPKALSIPQMYLGLSPSSSITAPMSMPSTSPLPALNTHSNAALESDVSSDTERDSHDTTEAAVSSGRKDMALAYTKRGLKALEIALKFAPISGLDSIATGLLMFVEVHEAVEENREKLETLRSSIQNFSDNVLVPIGSFETDVPPEMRDQISKLKVTLEKHCAESARIQEGGFFRRALLSPKITASIDSAKNAVESAIRTFTRVQVIHAAIETHALLVDATLQRLAVAKADYLHASKDACTPDTRVDMQATIMQHLDQPSNRFVWLRGSPGTGKTAISKSIAIALKRQGRLAASFYFEKTGANQFTDSTDRFSTTLARQLANFHLPYRHALFRHLRAQHGNYPLSPMEQLDELVVARLHEHPDMPFPPSVVVLDGLDECGTGDQTALEALMALVIELSKLPPPIKFLISSRPERAILEAWSRHSQTRSIITEDIDSIRVDQNRADIAKYVQESLSKIPARGSLDWPPSQEDVDTFADQCLGVFEIARIRVRFLEMAPVSERMDELLKDLLEPRAFPPGVSQFAQEYLWILRRSFPSPDERTNPTLESWQRGKRDKALRRFRTVIGAILAMRSPLSVKTLALLLQMGEDDMMSVLNPLSSIINSQRSATTEEDENEDGEAKISFFHATCSEFLRGKFNNSGSPVDRAFLFDNTTGAILAAPCLSFLVKTLWPGQLLHLSPSSALKSNPHSRALRYASKEWAYHLDLTVVSRTMLDALGLFLSQSLLAWLEFRWMIQPQMPLDEVNTIQKHLHGLSASVTVENFAPCDKWMHGVLSKAFAHWKFEAITVASENASSDAGEDNSAGGEGSIISRDTMTANLQEVQTCTLVAMLTRLSSLAERIRVFKPDFKPYSLFGRVSLDYSHSPELSPNIAERDQTTEKNSHVRCCTLSLQGRLALSQLDGGLQISQFRHAEDSFDLFPVPGWATNSLPSFVWLEFVANDQQLIGEDVHGIVWLLGENQIIDKFGPLPAPGPRSCAAASPNGMHVVRASYQPQDHQAFPWYSRMILLDIGDNHISLRAMTSPMGTAIGGSQCLNINPRTLGFSPDGKHVGAFDDSVAHIWSVESAHHLEQYDIVPGSQWIINPARKLTVLQRLTVESQPNSSLEALEPSKFIHNHLVYDISEDIDIVDALAIIDSSVFVTGDWEKVYSTRHFPPDTAFIYPNGLMICHLAVSDPEFSFVANAIHGNPSGRFSMLHLVNRDGHFNLIIGGGTGVITEGDQDEVIFFPPVITPISKDDQSYFKAWGGFLR
ncbi:hypothetical protein HWV62_43606 [Athelia sp. TMB]|nr:hypothetical protein HWV62_43606 [Athelia sp. TMB]